MDHARWTTILSRIDPRDAADIEDIARRFDPRAPRAGRDIFPRPEGCLPPSAAFKRSDGWRSASRVAVEPPDAADRAMRLAAFAIDRDVEVVVLAHCDRSGFERFGFRVERVTGDTEAERIACEEQILRFWNITLVL